MDTSNLTKLQVGLYSPLSFAGHVAMAGNYAYVTGTFARSHNVQVFDLTDPTRPRDVTTYDVRGSGRNLQVVGDFAYVFVMHGEEIGFDILDISNPRQPKKVSFQTLTAPAVNMFLSRGVAYITTEWGFELFDVSNPASPSKLGILDFTGGLGRQAGSDVATDVAVSGNIAYVTHTKNGLMVIDVSNPAKPTVVTAYKSFDMLKLLSATIHGDFVYLGDHGRLLVIDISNPGQPKQVALYPISGFAQQVVYKDGRVYVAGGPAGLEVIDVSDPREPVLVASRSLQGRTLGVTTDGNYIYAASGEGGLYVLERALNKGVSGSKVSRSPLTIGVQSQGSAVSLSVVSGTEISSLLPLSIGVPENRSTNHGPVDWRSLVRQFEVYPAPAVLPGSGQTWTVTSVADSGSGTLRWALENARSGDTITFDPGVFPPKSPVTIRLTTGLPYLSQGSLTIDGSNAGVILDGSATAKGTHGLLITSDHNVVKGLQVTGFPGVGIGIGGGSYNVIGGDRARGNGPSGEGNTIGGNKSVGVGISHFITGVATDIGVKLSEEGIAVGNRIIGNYIGTDPLGNAVIGSQGTGVYVVGKASQNIIGGTNPSERNIVSGNVRAGVSFMAAAHDNTVAESYSGWFDT